MTHDVGTSADKAALVSLDGEVFRSTSRSYPISCPHPGWQEQDPLDWWKAFCECSRELTEGLEKASVIGVSLTGQMMGCIPVDAAGEPVCPGMIWADSRAVEENREIEQKLGVERFCRITGLRPSPNGSISKIVWLKKNRPESYRKTSVFLSAKDFIGLRLTGVAAMDPETASYMYCYDRLGKCWSEEILEAAGVDSALLPHVIPSSETVGCVRAGAAMECGLPEGTPVVMAIGDGGAVTLGTATLEPGEVYTSLGTSSWVCAVTKPELADPQGRVAKITYLDTARDTGAMQAGGYSFNWIRGLLSPGQQKIDPVHLSALAEQSVLGANGVLFLPYLLGERAPYWDTNLRGSFLGMSGTTESKDLVRSVMEGVSIHLSIIFDLIRSINRIENVNSMKLVGGGANSPLWRSIFADTFGVPVTVLRQSDHVGALGVAVIAGVGLKAFSGYEVIRQFQKVDDIILPNPENVEKYRKLRSVHIRAKEALDTVKEEIALLNRIG